MKTRKTAYVKAAKRNSKEFFSEEPFFFNILFFFGLDFCSVIFAFFVYFLTIYQVISHNLTYKVSAR